MTADTPHLRLYGGPTVVTPEGQREFTGVQASLVALAYLDPPGSVTRERVAWMLWDEGEDGTTRHRIRQLVYKTNSRSPFPVLERQGDAIVPLLPSDLAEVDPDEAPPLARIGTPPTSAFEHWLDAAVERMRAKRLREWTEALDAAVMERDFARVITAARRLIGLASGPADALLDLAWALQCTGRTRSAVAELKSALASGAHVEEDQRRLEAALGAIQAATPVVASRRLRDESRRGLIPRHGLLKGVWATLMDPRVSTVVIYGPSAIGKTSILSEVRRDLSLRFPNSPILCALSPNGARPEPFHAFEILLRDPRAMRILRTAGGFTPILRRALPRLAHELGFADMGESSDALSPDLLVDHLSALLRDVSQGRRTLVVVDDLQLADRPSLDLLAMLASARAAASQLLGSVTATSRKQAEELTMHLMPGVANVAYFEVPELDLEGALQLLAAESGGSIPPEAARSVFSALGGVPGYLVEVARRANGEWTSLPSDAQELVERRLSQLSDGERSLCSYLAVAGYATSAQALGRVTGIGSRDLLAALERLVSQGILNRGPHGLWFRHSFLATGVYSRLTEGERRSLHSRFLADEEAGHETARSLERHGAAVGKSPDSLHPRLIMEAEEAERRGALLEAVRLWHQAEGVATAEDRGSALLRELDVLIRLRQYEPARRRLSAALSQPAFQTEGIRDLIQLRALKLQSLTDPGAVNLSGAKSLIDSLKEKGYEEGYASALDTVLAVADHQHDLRWLGLLLAEADRANPSTPDARTWIFLARTRHLYLGNPQRGLDSARAAVSEIADCNSNSVVSRALNRLIVALVFRGLLSSPEGFNTLRQARAKAVATGDAQLLYDTYVNEGSWLMDIGELSEAREAFDRAKGLLGPATSHLETLTTRVNLGELLILTGRAAEARAEFECALTFAGEEGAGRRLCCAGLALACLDLGQLRAASDWVHQIEDVSPAERFRGNLSLVAMARSRVAQAMGRPEEGLQILLDFARGMLPWMIPASLKLYLEAFRLALRQRRHLDRNEVNRVLSVAEQSGIPGHGLRLLQLRDRLLPESPYP